MPCDRGKMIPDNNDPKLTHKPAPCIPFLFQFNLVCSRKWYVTLTQSTFMVGQMLGAFTSGLIADRYF